MSKHKKQKFPKLLLLISIVLAIYLKIRDYLIIGDLSCGLSFSACPSIARFFLELVLWIIILFIMLFLLKFFSHSILLPEKKIKKNLMLKKANEQAAHKKKKKKVIKKEKNTTKTKNDEAADINNLDEDHTWNQVEVEAEKNTEEVIRI